MAVSQRPTEPRKYPSREVPQNTIFGHKIDCLLGEIPHDTKYLSAPAVGLRIVDKAHRPNFVGPTGNVMPSATLLDY